MRNVSRNKLWHCFRPMVDMDVVIEPKNVIDRSTDLRFTYISEENMEAMKVSGCGCSMDSEKNLTIVQQPTKKTFSRVVKAVLFETTLAKKVRDRKGFKQNSGKSKLSSSMSKERSLDLGSFQLLNTTLLSSTSSSSSSSSSSISESKVSSKSNLAKLVKQHHKKNAEKYSKESEIGHNGYNYGLYLLLISLTITVLWGRFWAVIFSSIWLYFLPVRNARNRWPENKKKWPEKESEDHKKKVIMEGLLERNHIRRGH